MLSSKSLSLLLNIILFLLFFSGIKSQSIFEKRYGGGGEERASSIVASIEGGYLLGGSTNSYGAGDHDMYLIKTDIDGNIIWSRTYGSTGRDRIHGIAQSNDGNYYLSGFLEGGFGEFDALVVKIDSTGNMIWARNIGGVQADELRSIVTTPDNGCVVSGYTSSFGFGSKDIYLIKFLPDGTKEWERVIGGTQEDHNFKCIINSDGELMLAGFSTIGSFWDATLIKTDIMGNVIWAKSYGGGGIERIHAFTETDEKGYVVVGQTSSFGAGGDDIFVFSIDSLGNVVWVKTFGTFSDETAYGVIRTVDNDYFIAGQAFSYVFGDKDAFLMKISSNGEIYWFKTYGGNNYEYVFDLISDEDNFNLIIGYSFSGDLGSSDVYLIKTDSLGTSECPYFEYTILQSDMNITAFNLPYSTTNGALVNNNNEITSMQPNSLTSQLCSMIPVELTSFDYIVKNKSVVLSWTTASEINNSGFEVLRNNESIGFVSGSGTTTEQRTYRFTDFTPLSGINKYTLIQVDFDGTSNRIGELEINSLIIPLDNFLAQNYPNPFNPQTTIEYSLKENNFVHLTIYDQLGNTVVKLVDEFKTAGRYTVKISADNLSSGVYYYTLRVGEFASTKKLILLK